jgi:hypothetical protein
MAQLQPLAGNPFALMMHPDDVLKAVECSNQIGGLQRRICRPLDRPVIPSPKKEGAAPAADFDLEIDQGEEPADDTAAAAAE